MYLKEAFRYQNYLFYYYYNHLTKYKLIFHHSFDLHFPDD